MKLYQKLIRPMHCYPGQHYEPLTEPVEKEEKWYPEEERERLEKKYASYNKGSFSDLIFEEKFEPYAIEPKFKKLDMVEVVRCKDCKYGYCINPSCDEKEKIYECMKYPIANLRITHKPDWFCADGKQIE